MPISVNKKLGANDRRSPDGPVISALLSAVVEDDTIVGWMKNSAFLVRGSGVTVFKGTTIS